MRYLHLLSLQVAGQAADQRNRLVGRQGQRSQVLEDASEPFEVGVALQKQGRCLGLNVDDIARASVGEPHERKRPWHAWMPTDGVRQRLERDLRQLGRGRQVFELVDAGAGDVVYIETQA